MQVHEVRTNNVGLVRDPFDIWPTARANEQRSIQDEFSLEAEILTTIIDQLANASSLPNISIGRAAQLFGTIGDPVQQVCGLCQIIFFDAPPCYAYLTITTPLAGTDGDAAVVETSECCSQRLFEPGRIVLLAHDQLEAQGKRCARLPHLKIEQFIVVSRAALSGEAHTIAQ